jgi:hypothetical protein
MPRGLAILDNSVSVSCCSLRECREHTVIEVDTEVPPIWQRIHVDQVPLRFFYLFPFIRQFLFRECPELALRGLPIARGHFGWERDTLGQAPCD